MIRQAISCDICGTDMQQTNHWFVAYNQRGEIRVAAWNSRTRLRSGAKHLCGQTCLHKLVDEFLVRTMPARTGAQAKAVESEERQAAMQSALPEVDRPQNAAPRLATRAVGHMFEPYVDEYESSARLILPVTGLEPAAPSTAASARAWRSEAWKREREREQGAEAHTDGARKRSIA